MWYFLQDSKLALLAINLDRDIKVVIEYLIILHYQYHSSQVIKQTIDHNNYNNTLLR